MIRASALRVPFRYAAGGAASRFLVALRDERRILGGRCPACARVYAPLTSFCHACGAAPLEEREVGPRGDTLACTARADGTVFTLVRLDGADTALLHRLLVDPAQARAGLRVRARFADQRRASILDIVGFEPDQRGPA